jgi:hypothetical protein
MCIWPCRPTISGEFARIDFNINDVAVGMPLKHVLISLITLAVRPFLEGLGEIVIRESEIGLVFARVQSGAKQCGHDASPASVRLGSSIPETVSIEG